MGQMSVCPLCLLQHASLLVTQETLVPVPFQPELAATKPAWRRRALLQARPLQSLRCHRVIQLE